MKGGSISNRLICGYGFLRAIGVGTRIWFAEEKMPYTVQASNVAFCILTKPFAAQHTVMYCAIDWEFDLRGPENLIFGRGAETKEQCEEMLQRLTSGETQVSSRSSIWLNISKAQPLRGKIYHAESEVSND